MGSALCTLFQKKPVNVLYFGLDASGKTTLLYHLKLGEIMTTIPTIGFNIETMDFNGIRVTSWDVGTRDKSRPLLRHYTDNTDGLVFFVDSSDRERLGEAVEELYFRFIHPVAEERQLPVLVLANKQDLDGVMSPEEIKDAILGKGGVIKSPLEVFPVSGYTLEGVDSAMQWLTSHLALRMARDSYLTSMLSATWSKAIHLPTSLLKSSYQRVSNFWSSKEKLPG